MELRGVQQEVQGCLALWGVVNLAGCAEHQPVIAQAYTVDSHEFFSLHESIYLFFAFYHFALGSFRLAKFVNFVTNETVRQTHGKRRSEQAAYNEGHDNADEPVRANDGNKVPSPLVVPASKEPKPNGRYKDYLRTCWIPNEKEKDKKKIEKGGCYALTNVVCGGSVPPKQAPKRRSVVGHVVLYVRMCF